MQKKGLNLEEGTVGGLKMLDGQFYVIKWSPFIRFCLVPEVEFVVELV